MCVNQNIVNRNIDPLISDVPMGRNFEKYHLLVIVASHLAAIFVVIGGLL